MEKLFRLLFIGDVILPASCSAVQALVPELRRELRLDAVIANGENSAASGFGITAPLSHCLPGRIGSYRTPRRISRSRAMCHTVCISI